MLFGSISTAARCSWDRASDAGLLAYLELDDALGLTEMAGESRNGRHTLVGLLRQSVFGRLAGYEDVNHVERLRHDPATIRWIVGGTAAQVTQHRRARWAASKLSGSRHPRTSVLLPTCLAIGSSSCRRPPRGIVLDRIQA
jgi:hypothetical protein